MAGCLRMGPIVLKIQCFSSPLVDLENCLFEAEYLGNFFFELYLQRSPATLADMYFPNTSNNPVRAKKLTQAVD